MVQHKHLKERVYVHICNLTLLMMKLGVLEPDGDNFMSRKVVLMGVATHFTQNANEEAGEDSVDHHYG